VAGSSLAWEQVVRDAQRVRATLQLRDVCVYLRREFEVEIPEAVVDALGEICTPRRERVAHRFSGARAGPLGAMPMTLTRWLRATAGKSATSALIRFPGFLQAEWGLARRSQLPLVALRKLRRPRGRD
jgi:hypothetical protein